MQRILIVEGLCAWNSFVHKMLVAEGYDIWTVRGLTSVWQPLDYFQPDLVLVGLGVEHAQAWHIFEQLKAYDADLPVLVYQIVNGQSVDDFKRVVSAALREADQRRKQRHKACDRLAAAQMVG